MGRPEEEERVTVTNAYAVVPTQEEVDSSSVSEMVMVVPAQHLPTTNHTEETSTSTAAAAVTTTTTATFVDTPLGTGVSPHYQHIPEACALTWRDDFFEDDNDNADKIIAVFDFDYNRMEERYRCIGWSAVAGTVLCFPGSLFWCLIGLVPCYLNRNVSWSVRAKHVAVTRDGVLFVQDERQSCWGDPCRLAKTSRLVPFDQIQNIVITEATSTTGSSLSKIVFEGASQPQKLVVEGLENPVALKNLVLALKAMGQSLPPASSKGVVTSTNLTPMSPVHVTERIERGISMANGNTEEVATLLRDIRNELRQHNDILQSMQQQQPQQSTVTPTTKE